MFTLEQTRGTILSIIFIFHLCLAWLCCVAKKKFSIYLFSFIYFLILIATHHSLEQSAQLFFFSSQFVFFLVSFESI